MDLNVLNVYLTQKIGDRIIERLEQQENKFLTREQFVSYLRKFINSIFISFDAKEEEARVIGMKRERNLPLSIIHPPSFFLYTPLSQHIHFIPFQSIFFFSRSIINLRAVSYSSKASSQRRSSNNLHRSI